MKKSLIILCIFMLTTLLLSCGADVEPEHTDDMTWMDENCEAVTVLCEETVDVQSVEYSPLAKAEFLEPIEDFSWEREFAPEYVVIHFTSAVVLSKEDPYNMETVRNIFVDGGISINYIIDRDGEIYCYMPETRAAWHAGKGYFGGDERLTNAMNKYSIGIEVLAIGSENDMAQYLEKDEYVVLDKSFIGYTDAQYESLSLLVRDICSRNEIPFERTHVIGHEEYSLHKSDPGELFDWSRILN